MKKIYFEDEGQDVLWWIIDDKGIVKACDMQEWVWKGTEVLSTEYDCNLNNIEPGDRLVCKFPDGVCGKFQHTIEKVEDNVELPAGA